MADVLHVRLTDARPAVAARLDGAVGAACGVAEFLRGNRGLARSIDRSHHIIIGGAVDQAGVRITVGSRAGDGRVAAAAHRGALNIVRGRAGARRPGENRLRIARRRRQAARDDGDGRRVHLTGIGACAGCAHGGDFIVELDAVCKARVRVGRHGLPGLNRRRALAARRGSPENAVARRVRHRSLGNGDLRSSRRRRDTRGSRGSRELRRGVDLARVAARSRCIHGLYLVIVGRAVGQAGIDIRGRGLPRLNRRRALAARRRAPKDAIARRPGRCRPGQGNLRVPRCRRDISRSRRDRGVRGARRQETSDKERNNDRQVETPDAVKVASMRDKLNVRELIMAQVLQANRIARHPSHGAVLGRAKRSLF